MANPKNSLYDRLLQSRFALTIALVTLFAGSDAVAEIYKWVDANGQTHYGEKPPQNVRSEQIKTRGSVSSTTVQAEQPDQQERLQRQQRLLDVYAQEREEREAERASERASKERREKVCNQARRELKDYGTPGNVFYDYDKAGKRYFLDGDEVRSRMAEIERFLQKNCR